MINLFKTKGKKTTSKTQNISYKFTSFWLNTWILEGIVPNPIEKYSNKKKPISILK